MIREQNSIREKRTAFEQALQSLAPGISHGQTALLFGQGVRRSTVQGWRNGRRSVPQWAKDKLRAELDRHHQAALAALAQEKTGPGKRAGYLNLARWRAAKRD